MLISCIPLPQVDLYDRLKQTIVNPNQPIASSSKLSPVAEVKESGTPSPSESWIGENAMDQYFKTEDKGKSIDFNELSQSEVTRRITEQVTGDFVNESQNLLGLMNHFLNSHQDNNFPNVEIKKAMYSTISTQLSVLGLKYKKLYAEWLRKDNNASTVLDFYELEKLIDPSVDEENTYNEVEKVAAQEQEAWSDGPNSSVHSPYVKEEKFDEDNKVELPENQVSMLAPFLEELEAVKGLLTPKGSPLVLYGIEDGDNLTLLLKYKEGNIKIY